MDKVCISGLKMDAVIGIHDWEREIRQGIVLDLEMASDARVAAKTDAIEDALDYAAISARLINFVTQSEFQLIETLAEEIATLLQAEFQVPWLSLRVSKPGAVPEAKNISVLIERGASH
jgi:7,8-dihydroneopterin aldolase/epimerase/oxygenase